MWMPKLPKCGWFQRCEDCQIITSRLTTIKHRRKTKRVPVCLQCRPGFILILLKEFNVVIIDKESTAEQYILVSD
jgi:hypothetical protein